MTQETGNVVTRLHSQIRDAKKRGFHVRIEPLDEGQSGWCQIGKKRFIFLEASHTAAEQLAQLHETIQSAEASVAKAA